MRKTLAIFSIAASLLLTGCTDQAIYLDNLHKSATPEPSVYPQLTNVSAPANCSDLSATGTPWLQAQGFIQIIRTTYAIGVFKCAETSDAMGLEYVESFVYDKGAWASNGLVGGDGNTFEVTGECQAGEAEIKCPAIAEGLSGSLIVFNQDGGPEWRFASN